MVTPTSPSAGTRCTPTPHGNLDAGRLFHLVRPLADQLRVAGRRGAFEEACGDGGGHRATYRRAQMLLPVAESLAA